MKSNLLLVFVFSIFFLLIRYNFSFGQDNIKSKNEAGKSAIKTAARTNKTSKKKTCNNKTKSCCAGTTNEMGVNEEAEKMAIKKDQSKE